VRLAVTTDPLPKAADAERLTEAFRRFGVVDHQRVCNVVVMTSLAKLRSQTFRLSLDYDGVPGEAPRSVILKTGHLEGARRAPYANRHEIEFYRNVAPALPSRLVPRCFEAVGATDNSPWHLLLEDLTDSHFIATEWPLPPALEQCQSIVRAQARFHAALWDNPRLGTSIGNWRDADAVDRDLQRFAELFASFTDRFGEMLPPERRALYRGLLDQAPRLLARYHSRRNLSLFTVTRTYGIAFCLGRAAAKTSG
jgi:Ecdysteroid kinase-like family